MLSFSEYIISIQGSKRIDFFNFFITSRFSRRSAQIRAIRGSRQRKALDGFLRQKPVRATKFETNWDAILSFWNIGDSNMSVDLNQPQPDYSTIREN